MRQLQHADYDLGGFGAETLNKMFLHPRIHDTEAIAESVSRLPDFVLPEHAIKGRFAFVNNGRVVAAGSSSSVHKGVYSRFDPVGTKLRGRELPKFDEIYIQRNADLNLSGKQAERLQYLIGNPVPDGWERFDIPYIPPFAGVYILLWNDAPAYCGQSVNVPARLCDHLYRESKTKGQFNRIKTMEISSHEVRAVVEACLIHALKPPLSRWLGLLDRHAHIAFEATPSWWKGH